MPDIKSVNGAKAKEIVIPITIVIGLFTIVFWLGWFAKTIVDNEEDISQHTKLPIHPVADVRVAVVENALKTIRSDIREIKEIIMKYQKTKEGPH